MSFILAIDGPAGSGKGTLAKEISRLTDLINIDTGATYRCVTLAAIQKGYTLEDSEKIVALLDEIDIRLEKIDGEDKFFLNGEDVSKKIREKEVTQMVSYVSGITEVRIKMAEFQRKLAEGKDVIMEGRDIGTVVLKDAELKFFLIASIETRAARRIKQLNLKGEKVNEEEVLPTLSPKKCILSCSTE